MPHENNEQAKPYLWDMREAARQITDFVRGVNFHEFEKSKLIRSAVERQLLIIGEAAVHISPQYRKQHSEVPWNILIGFRNVLAHEYGETLLNRVWLGATVTIPELLAVLIRLLPDES